MSESKRKRGERKKGGSQPALMVEGRAYLSKNAIKVMGFAPIAISPQNTIDGVSREQKRYMCSVQAAFKKHTIDAKTRRANRVFGGENIALLYCNMKVLAVL